MSDAGTPVSKTIKSPGLVFGDIGTGPIYTVGTILLFTITTGSMEVIDIIPLLQSRGIDEMTIFYGIETIVSDKSFRKIYSIIRKVSPPFVQF